MSNYIFLELDTKPPVIEILAPKYTTKNILNRITVQANEDLSDYQDIYIVDSNNIRHDYTFSKERKDRFVGFVNFADYPIGIVTIYARLRDEVDNTSNLASSIIEIKETIPLLRLEINDFAMNMSSSTKVKRVSVSDKTMKVKINSNDKFERWGV